MANQKFELALIQNNSQRRTLSIHQVVYVLCHVS